MSLLPGEFNTLKVFTFLMCFSYSFSGKRVAIMLSGFFLHVMPNNLLAESFL